LNSITYFRIIPIEVTFFYCKLFISITPIFYWITSQLFKFKYKDLSNFLYRSILILSQLMFSSTLVNPMILVSYQISSWDHFDPMSHLPKSIFLIHIYSNCNCATWVGYEFISIIDSILAIVVFIQFYYHSSWSYFIMFNEPLELCS
jgi:hypothetical protein